MKKQWYFGMIVGVVCMGLSLVGGSLSSVGVNAAYAGKSKASKKASKKVKKKVSAAVLKLGKKTYGQLCALCHGAKGHGDGPGAKGLKIKPTAYGKGVFRYGGSFKQIMKSITKGILKNGMASYGWMPMKKRVALVHYIQFLSRQGKKK